MVIVHACVPILAWCACVCSAELGLRASFAIASSKMRIDVTANIKIVQTVINITLFRYLNSSEPFFQGSSKFSKYSISKLRCFLKSSQSFKLYVTRVVFILHLLKRSGYSL